MKLRDVFRKDLLAILLDAGGAQTGKTMLVNRELPGQEFVDCQRIAATSFLEGKKAAADCSNNFGLTADYPPFCAWRGKVRNGQGTAIGPDDVLDPRAVGFCHVDTHKLELLNSQKTTLTLPA